MNVRFRDLSRETAELQPELDLAIHRVLQSGVLRRRREVEAFEHEFATFCGAGYAVGVNSGTDALGSRCAPSASARATRSSRAANTCIATVAGIVAAGATPVLVDVEPTR